MGAEPKVQHNWYKDMPLDSPTSHFPELRFVLILSYLFHFLSGSLQRCFPTKMLCAFIGIKHKIFIIEMLIQPQSVVHLPTYPYLPTQI
jgi:hypothetical protein